MGDFLDLVWHMVLIHCDIYIFQGWPDYSGNRSLLKQSIILFHGCVFVVF